MEGPSLKPIHSYGRNDLMNLCLFMLFYLDFACSLMVLPLNLKENNYLRIKSKRYCEVELKGSVRALFK